MLVLPALLFLLAPCQSTPVTAMDAPTTSADVESGPFHPDVLVFVADDFNWLDLQSVSAPNITALASQGMTFRNAYAFPICSTTRYSLLFGRYPRRDGIGALVALAPPSPGNPTPTMGLPTLPLLLRDVRSGPYHGLLVGKWHLGTNPDYDGDPAPDIGPVDIGALTPILHGFERFLAGAMASPAYFDWMRVDDGVYSTESAYAPEAQLEAFTEWWHTTTRRFAVFCTTLPHVPVHVPSEEWLPPGYPAPVTARQKFESMLVACDTLVGRVLAEVDLSRTYVFFLADNGTQPQLSITPCGPDATFAGCTKTTTWQGGINVPFVVAGPGIPPGTSTDALVSSSDVMATIAELFHLDSPGEDSISFAPVLRDPSARTRHIAFSEIFGWFYGEDLELYYRHELAAVGERYKLRVLGTDEFLYDLVADPGETTRLDVDDPELAPVVDELRAVLADPLDRSLQE